jgi:hypothetical protein
VHWRRAAHRFHRRYREYVIVIVIVCAGVCDCLVFTRTHRRTLHLVRKRSAQRLARVQRHVCHASLRERSLRGRSVSAVCKCM